jgi:AraC family transcriptional activator of pobA
MHKNAGSIPVNKFGDDSGAGISIERIAFENLPDLGEWEQPERHDRHAFFLIETGTVTLEIDFQKYSIIAPSIIYMHPDQVHRIIAFENISVSTLAMNSESLNPEFLKLLEEITPTVPMPLNRETFVLLAETASLCTKFAERKKDQLYQTLLKSQCNTLIGLIISPYLEPRVPAEKLSRTELVNKAFRESLALHFTRLKRPADYAEKLHLSSPYLNECVKNTTGQSVGYHIQQRVILEAKRLLYHSDSSLKEIAAALGYDDYAYFSRLFTKIAGLSPLSFRNKNLD